MRMISHFASAACAALIATVPQLVAAATFDLTELRGNFSAPLEITADDGLTATLSAFDENGNIGSMNFSRNGVGVQGAPEGGRLALAETLVFEFSNDPVSFDGVAVFEAGAEAESVQVLSGGVLIERLDLPAANGNSTVEFDLSALNLVTNEITLVGLAPNAPGNLGVRLASLSVTAVPLPASALLLLAGIGGLVLVRRKA